MFCRSVASQCLSHSQTQGLSFWQGVISSLGQCGHCSCEQFRTCFSKPRHSLLDFVVQLFDVEVQSIAILRAMRLEVEDHTNSVAAERLLIEHTFNSVNRILNRLIPTIRELEILLSPSIRSPARDPRCLHGVVNRTMSSQGINEPLFCLSRIESRYSGYSSQDSYAHNDADYKKDQ